MSLHLLIVEPNRPLLDTYCAFFGRAGLTVSTAANGQTAKRHFLQGTIDTVLLEPDLPDDQNDLLQLIADHTDERPLPVVVVSRRTQLELKHPVLCYEVKPVSMSHLLECIQQAAKRIPIGNN